MNIFNNPLMKLAATMAVAAAAAEVTATVNNKMNKNGVGINISVDPANMAGQVDIQCPVGHIYAGFLSQPAVQTVVNQQPINLQPVENLYQTILAAQAANNAANAANAAGGGNNNPQQP